MLGGFSSKQCGMENKNEVPNVSGTGFSSEMSKTNCRLLMFFKMNIFEKLIREYHQSVKQFGSRSSPTFCRA